MTVSAEKRKTLADSFAALRAHKRIGLVPFIPAGYPDLETLGPGLRALDAAGAAAIEIGFPFSDPIADGPTVQEAFGVALARKLKMADVFRAVADVRPSVAAPLVSMVSYSIVYRYGQDRFFADAKAAGFNGLILPDLPPPEAEGVCDRVRSAGLDTILMVASTTTPARRKEIVRLSSGFVYYLSVSGITGERDQLPPNLPANVAQLKQLGDRPICVGFGIHKPEQVRQLSAVADGAIIGSAIVRRMRQHASEGPQGIAKAVGDYCQSLLA